LQSRLVDSSDGAARSDSSRGQKSEQVKRNPQIYAHYKEVPQFSEEAKRMVDHPNSKAAPPKVLVQGNVVLT